MNRKGIAITQVAMLILAVLVIALVGYLLYINFVAGGGQFDVDKCRAAIISACTSCKVGQSEVWNNEEDCGNMPGDDLCPTAATNVLGVTSITKNNCAKVGIS